MERRHQGGSDHEGYWRTLNADCPPRSEEEDLDHWLEVQQQCLTGFTYAASEIKNMLCPSRKYGPPMNGANSHEYGGYNNRLI